MAAGRVGCVNQAMMKPQGTDQQSASRIGRKPPDPRLPSILVVEDDDDIRRMTAELLQQSGFRVDAAENGAAAWNALLANGYDLVITDNSMPVLTGLELLAKMHEAQMSVPVIMASGTMPWKQFANSPWLQPAATLLKPYTFAELIEVMWMVLRVERDPQPVSASESLHGAIKSFAV